MFHVVSSTGEVLATTDCILEARDAERRLPKAHHIERDDGVHMTEPSRFVSTRSNAPVMGTLPLMWGAA